MKKLKTIHKLPSTNIVIDYWKSFEYDDTCIRFMTVFRLENDQLQCMKQSNYKIYTSGNNKKLLELHEIPADRIIEIEPGICIEIIDEHAKYSFKVSTIASNYCAGSCMFLFQGPFGNILYTGFFRPAVSSDPLTDPILKDLIRDQRIDEVYIDNSYAAEHCRFPSRADVIKDAVRLIRGHPEHKVIIAGNKFGKEEILRDIAMSLDEPIGVSRSKYEELSFMMMQQSLPKFSPHQDECRIIVEDELLSFKLCKEKQAKEGLCIIILLTAQYICEELRCGIPAPQLSSLHILPYSSHASHCELMEFLYNLRARKIMPIILTESENTIIPKKMMEMCYADESSASLRDSDFYFETFTQFPASTNDCGSVADGTFTSHHNWRNSTGSVDDVINEEEIDSVQADVYHESKSVAFVSLLEVQDEVLSDEGRNAENVVDPLSVSESYGVSPVCDFVETTLNFDRTESVARSPTVKLEENSISSSVLETSGETREASFLDTSSSNPALLYNNNRIEEQRIDTSAVSNSENNPPRTSHDEDVCCDEISSSDTVGNYYCEMEVSISNHSDNENVESHNFSSPLIEECTSEKDEKLGAVLHHIWLVTTAEDWQSTKLTKDSWAAFQ